MKYCLLMDDEHKDVVIRQDYRKSYEFVFGSDGQWRRISLLDYYTESSPKYEKMRMIDRETALLMIDEQNKRIDSLLKTLEASADRKCNDKVRPVRNSPVSVHDILSDEDLDKEQRAVFLLFLLGRDYLSAHADIFRDMPRIVHAAVCLFDHIEMSSEKDLLQLRIHRGTWNICIKYFTGLCAAGKISKEQRDIIVDYMEQRIISLNEEQKSVLFA